MGREKRDIFNPLESFDHFHSRFLIPWPFNQGAACCVCLALCFHFLHFCFEEKTICYHYVLFTTILHEC